MQLKILNAAARSSTADRTDPHYAPKALYSLTILNQDKSLFDYSSLQLLVVAKWGLPVPFACQVYVVGSGEKLGGWSPDGALMLTTGPQEGCTPADHFRDICCKLPTVTNENRKFR